MHCAAPYRERVFPLLLPHMCLNRQVAELGGSQRRRLRLPAAGGGWPWFVPVTTRRAFVLGTAGNLSGLPTVRHAGLRHE